MPRKRTPAKAPKAQKVVEIQTEPTGQDDTPEAPTVPEAPVETNASRGFRESVKKALKKQWDEPGRPM